MRRGCAGLLIFLCVLGVIAWFALALSVEPVAPTSVRGIEDIGPALTFVAVWIPHIITSIFR